MDRIFDQGVCKRGLILIWEYAEGNNFDLGVRKYQKVENPWCIGSNRSSPKSVFITFMKLGGRNRIRELHTRGFVLPIHGFILSC
jgi:hypothetical protein